MRNGYFLASFCLLAVLVAAVSANMHAQDSAGAHRALRGSEDEWWDFYQRENPEIATQLGEYRYNDKLTDYSLAHVERVNREAAGLLARLEALNAAALSEQDQLDRTLLVRTLQDQLKGIQLKNYEMPVDQFNGVQILFPQIPAYAPFDTVKHYDDYIARLKQIPGRFEQLIATLTQGEKDGLMQPRYLLEMVVPQCQNVADPAGEANPFGTPATRIPPTFSTSEKKRLHAEIISVIDEQVRPAYRKLQEFVARDYAPKGRVHPGIWSLPEGDERYRFDVHLQTTSNLTPEQIHELGLAQVTDLESQIEALAKKSGYPDGKTFIKAVHADPKLKAKSREQILDNFRRYIGQMEPKLPELFGVLPKAKLVVRSVPEYMEKESSTQYINGTPDGSRPGQVWVDTYDPTHHDMLDDEATAYHEGVPGHHLQISIAQELPGIHPFHRALQYNAYVEGWALYAERLGKEVGFYQDPASDLGRLQSELFRAVRLVVDTGVHYKRWTRQQMVDFFNQHFGEAPQSEVDRYIAWPGQALGYKLGQLKILELRQRAQKELGSKFDSRAFHDEVLSAGALPLDLLDARMTRWISNVQKH
jgi:uncharacterized protein (DUF885 family)